MPLMQCMNFKGKAESVIIIFSPFLMLSMALFNISQRNLKLFMHWVCLCISLYVYPYSNTGKYTTISMKLVYVNVFYYRFGM